MTFGAAMYQLGFAGLGAASGPSLGAWDVPAVALFVAGSALNMGSEWARLRFKRRPENRGRLYTRGPFALVRHPNYLGDVLWGVDWALATRSAWSAIIVAVEVAGFVFVNIPQLSAHLEERYGDAYRTWASRTARRGPGRLSGPRGRSGAWMRARRAGGGERGGPATARDPVGGPLRGRRGWRSCSSATRRTRSRSSGGQDRNNPPALPRPSVTRHGEHGRQPEALLPCALMSCCHGRGRVARFPSTQLSSCECWRARK